MPFQYFPHFVIFPKKIAQLWLHLLHFLDFYQNALGFKAIKEHNNLASVQRDEVVIEFRRSHKACGRSEAEFNQNRDLDIEVQEIEALYNQLEKKNVRIINSISKDRLGHKNFQIVDCNGYVIVFTQRHTDK